MATTNKLKTTYYNSKSPGGFGGINRLYKNVKTTKVGDIKNWIRYQDTYTLHKPVRYRFPRRRTIVSGLKEQFQCDLIDVQRLRKENDGYGYILTCIDVFSKMADAVPIKNKTSSSVIPAFDTIFDTLGSVRRIQSDKGVEFMNKTIQQYFKKRGVHHFTTQNETTKAAICERWNRTLLSRLYRVFTFNKNQRYVEVLPELVSAYNRSYHRSIKMRPVDVTLENQEKVWQTLYGSPKKHHQRNSLKLGMTVRISSAKQTFRKGYLPLWSGELFTICRVLATTPQTFVIEDVNGDEIAGTFYQQELQRVGGKEVYEVERVIREKKAARGRSEVLVKWKDYPESFNSWIPKNSLKTL